MNKSIVCAALISLMACGGGSSDGSGGTVFEGVMLDGDAVSRLAHSTSEPHTEAELSESTVICALGACSETDESGRWGFRTTSAPAEVLFSIDGHGVSSTLTVRLPANASDVFIELESHGDDVHAHEVIVDGAPYPQ